MGFFRELIDSEYKELKRFEKIANEIDALSEEMEALSDEELKAKTAEFKEQLENNEDINKYLPSNTIPYLNNINNNALYVAWPSVL